MRITVKYMAQLKHAAGVASDEIELGDSATLGDVVRAVAERRGEAVKRMLLDSTGAPQPALLVFVNDQQVPVDSPAGLADRQVLTLLTPMSGG